MLAMPKQMHPFVSDAQIAPKRVIELDTKSISSHNGVGNGPPNGTSVTRIMQEL